MEEKNREPVRGPILGHVAGIPVANTAYSGDLIVMTVDDLFYRLYCLDHLPNPDTDVGFEAKMVEGEAICAELRRKGLSDKQINNRRYPDQSKAENKTTWWERMTRIFRS